MSPDRAPHLSSETILDLLEDRLTDARRRKAEEHLGLPCARCRERLREMGALLGRLRAGDLEAVPESLSRAALELFPGATPEPKPGALEVLKWALTFDSSAHPLAASTRRAVGEARRLRFETGDARLELEIEAESAEQCVLRGRIDVPSPELHRVVAEIRGERFETWADAGGHFVLEGVPRDELKMRVLGPERRIETPTFET